MIEEYYKTLSNDKVALEPLTEEHIEAMKQVCHDPSIWKWFTIDLSDGEVMANWMRDRLKASSIGMQMTFAVRDLETGKIVGTTSYGNIELAEKVIEIGWTWIGGDYIGMGLNKHMKFLMLNYAFEEMGIERLELRTDELNVRSRRAMEKIGAKYDAKLRSHRFTQGNRRRDTVVYSILKVEWPEVRKTIFKNF